MKKLIIFVILICAMMLQSIAQVRQVTGFVKDETGEGIPGASIVIEGTSIGTITDNVGKFALNVEGPQPVIVVSFIGYGTQRVVVGNLTMLEINLVSTVENLEEVVVVGYGIQQKVSVVGAISSISSEELREVATPNLANSLAGRVPGLIINHGEGRPGGDDPVISIRGAGTINDTSPLVLIDGMEGDLGRVNSNDIESFSVLKDASATAVYGVRGANGVILITTKRGIVGKSEVFVSGQYRMHKIINYPKFLGSYDYARLYNEASINMGQNPFYSEADLEHYRTGDSPYTHPDVNWLDATTKPYAPEKRFDVNLRGGTKSVKYFVAAEFLTQDGNYRQWENENKHSTNARYDRFNLRMNFDFKLTGTTDLGVNLNGRIQDTQNVFYGPVEGYGIWHAILLARPIDTALLNPDGSIAGSLLNDNNHYATLRRGSSYTEKDQGLTGLLNFSQKLDFVTKGLGFRFKTGISTTLDYTYRVIAQEPTYQYIPGTDTYLQILQGNLPRYSIASDGTANNPYLEAAFTYDRSFGKHHFTALALYNQDKRARNSNPWTAHRGFAGRATIDLFGKYLGEANVGYNGSTQFEKQERFAFLPAVSAGWIVSEEKFFKEKFSLINFFKIRGSYGLTGNDKIGNYQYLYLSVFQNDRAYRFGEAYTNYPALSEASLANENVTWEIAKKQNYGFDMQLLDGMFGLGFDYFIENRSNILATRNTITQVSGLQQSQLPPENFGKVNNKGLEIAASFRKTLGNFSVKVEGNFSRTKNTIIDIDEVKNDLDYKNRTGKPIGQNFGYTWSHQFYTFEELGYIWDESVEGGNKYVLPEGAVPSVPVPTTPVFPGDLKFVDRNNDGVIDNLDSGAIGYSDNPEFLYGLNYTIKYKSLSLNMFWQGAGRFNRSLHGLEGVEFYNNSNVHELHLDRWAFYDDPYTGELIDTRATAAYPRLIIGGNSEALKNSDFRTYRADYIRLKNVELSYDLPKSMLGGLKIKNAKVFLTGYNLLTFAKYKWTNPEGNSKGGSGSIYPITAYLGAGFNLGF